PGTGMLGPDQSGAGNVVEGVIPTKSLHLPDDYAFDQWGRRISYVVDKRATLTSSCTTLQNYPTNNGTGGINIAPTPRASATGHVMHAYIIHGPSGEGAFPGAGSITANRINTGTTDADMLTNAGVISASNFTVSGSSFTNTKIQKGKTSTFDHVVYYRTD